MKYKNHKDLNGKNKNGTKVHRKTDKKSNPDKASSHIFLKRFLKILTVLMLILTVITLILGLSFAVYVEKNIEKDIDESLFTSVGSESETRIFYYDFEDRENRIGEVRELTQEKLYGGYRCEFTEYENIPKELINAFVSIEDKRFYKHKGVDFLRSFTAGINYFLKFSSSYGGSTITQQLIKNVTQKDDYSFQRKMQEIFWALDLESKMSKKEILEMYLNIINMSDGCYGVKTAADYYFSKDVSELTLNECACIAAITNSPSYYNPIKNPQNNSKRRDVILNQMFEQGYISEEEFKENYGKDVILSVHEAENREKINSWYVDTVIEDVINDLMSQKGYSRQMANLKVYTGGLKIYCAMDKEVQDKVEKYYRDTKHFYSAEKQENPQSSVIVIDSKTGDILGVAGAVGEKKGNRVQNFATGTKRPVGSVIKPVAVYAPAMEMGLINWASVYDDTPVNFGKYNTDISKGEIVPPKPWPKNSNGKYRGLTNINYAIEHSVNTVVVKVLEKLGLENSFDFLQNKLHIESLIEGEKLADGSYITDKGYAALALGQLNYGMTSREITAAYSIFANNGIYNETRSYFKVLDSYGNEVLKKDYKGEIVLSEENAGIMTKMLENVIKNGTGKAITLDETVNCAGKTGTTQNNYDKWFIGYTPYYICGVWYGYEYPKAIHSQGGNPCIKIFDGIMNDLHKNEKLKTEGKYQKFQFSENITETEYCIDSGMAPSDVCKNDPRGNRIEKGYFVKGTEPKNLCTTHISVAYDILYGGVAGYDCPKENIKYVGLLNIKRIFPMQIYVSDAEYVWRDIGKEILPETSPFMPFYANLLKEGEYCGISNREYQYNRFCREDFNYTEWLKRKHGET